MKQELEKIKLDFNERIDALILKNSKDVPEVEFEVGRYVYIITATSGACGCEGYVGKITTRPNSDHYNGCDKKESDLFIELIDGRIWAMNKDTTKIRPATESEVKEALIKEAEKKLKDKGKILGIRSIEACEDWNGENPKKGSFSNTASSRLGLSWYYNAETDTLYNWGWGLSIVYEKGVFASIVKEEAIDIGGYEVKILTNHKTEIEGNLFTREFWEAALKISEHSKAGVWVGCGAKSLDSSIKWYVSPEKIKSILEKLK